MYKFNKILVGLDHTSMDEELINAACTVCQLSGSKEIYFINIVRDFNLPDDVRMEFPDIIDKAIEERKTQIESEVLEKFACNGVTPHFIIKQGQPTKEIMKFAAEQKIDLIVIGRKKENSSSGVLIQRLARRAGCSLLIVPSGKEMKMGKIHVPVDFSSYSKMALEKAVTFAKKLSPTPEIIVQNVYQVPSGYHYTGKSYDEFSKIMKDHAEKDYKVFIQDLKLGDIKLNDLYTLDKEDDVIAEIYKKAKKEKADLIIIGAKGRSSTTAIFIGSKAEKFLHLDSEIPVMVVRPKGKRAGIREYLKEL